jgi:hypothetical protein
MNGRHPVLAARLKVLVSAHVVLSGVFMRMFG